MEYISREAALEQIREYIEEYGWTVDEHGWHTEKWCAMQEAEDVIESIPAADVREVVTCGECKYNGHCFTQSFVRDESILPFDPDTWFCADGER